MHIAVNCFVIEARRKFVEVVIGMLLLTEADPYAFLKIMLSFFITNTEAPGVFGELNSDMIPSMDCSVVRDFVVPQEVRKIDMRNTDNSKTKNALLFYLVLQNG